MNIGVILTRHSPHFIKAAEIMRSRGARVDLIDAGAPVRSTRSVRVEHDLYVIKSGRGSALALAGLLHAAGAETLWPYPLAAAHKDKLQVAAELSAAGLPVPETFAARSYRDLEGQLAGGPLVVKPQRGSRGEGVVIVSDAASLGQLPEPVADEPIIAQRYLVPDEGGSYIVGYRIGDEVFALRRTWPPDGGDPTGALIDAGPLEALVRRCGEVYGVDLYSVDLVVSGGEAHVVDMSLHAGFEGVPDTAGRIADYLTRALA